MESWPQPSRVTRFTFVRDPLTRFVSGYRELEYRCKGVWTRYRRSHALPATPACPAAALVTQQQSKLPLVRWLPG